MGATRSKNYTRAGPPPSWISLLNCSMLLQIVKSFTIRPHLISQFNLSPAPSVPVSSQVKLIPPLITTVLPVGRMTGVQRLGQAGLL
jgi:hypothetical protein